ncbi:uncharacterized protein BX663DRAFT_491900 [Cokeromyces recurvatus]|uniref:uncharacterized protein n=1 Tax=Cokeromyces recurvatus TaxID=90255 RepID=UPI00222053A9|nr:uncharacterized protein BX663DRAFT_491900 [Cokeromyces recurvatus]KAI7907742.1 hypothetical protein BX663DRAFT_491900 [Cokeromyces recurvatus]
MDDDTIEYYFDSIENFYAELDDVLNQPYNNETNVKKITTQYIRFLVRYQHEFLKSSVEFAQVAYKLIDSQLCLDYSTVVLSHILNEHALVSQDKTELLVSFSLLLYAGKDEPRWLEFILLDSIQMKKNRLFCKIITEVRLGFYDCYKLLHAAFSLCYELCKLAKVDIEDLSLIDTSLVNYLLDIVEKTRGDADESFNYDVIRLIMVFNEQYMMSGLNENLILDVLSQRIGTSDTFSANLIFMLNRLDDLCTQMLILKLLYGIFTTPTLHEYFYTNDLYVLVDITLRELCNLSDTKESQTLQEAYLRVFEQLLGNTQLRERPYKKQETYKILNCLLNPGMRRKVNSTTKRLVKRIIQDWWEKICCELQDNKENMTSSTNSSVSTISTSSGLTTPKNEDDEISIVINREEMNEKVQQDSHQQAVTA